MKETDLYRARERDNQPLVADIPATDGIDVYVFSGPELAVALQRYILFSGGGPLIPEWGLGVCYRACADFAQSDIRELAASLRRFRIPCDVLGLEPGWQTHAYSCSLVWNRKRFPDPEGLCAGLRASGYRVNLWEHLFIHPDSPLHAPLESCSGDFRVWEGLVPDLSLPRAEKTFRDYHRRELVGSGVSAFKLDECDNSDFICAPWSFPECSRFPSGKDGEVMHSMLGNLYMDCVRRACEESGVRTCGQVRNEHALASAQPFFLYSDLYDHREFLRGVPSAGISGMLWAPEIRSAVSDADYRCRLQSAVLAPQFMLNVWSMPHPPWTQYDPEKNRRGEFFAVARQRRLRRLTREILTWRMRFIPLLYAVFARYHFFGEVPFLPPVAVDPDNPDLREVDTAWLVGRRLYVLPRIAGEEGKKVFFPAGKWRDFFTGAPVSGSAEIPPGENLPLFVRDNSLIPLALPGIRSRTGRQKLVLRLYGSSPEPAELYAGDADDFAAGPENFGCVYPDGTLDVRLRKKYCVTNIEKIG